MEAAEDFKSNSSLQKVFKDEGLHSFIINQKSVGQNNVEILAAITFNDITFRQYDQKKIAKCL